MRHIVARASRLVGMFLLAFLSTHYAAAQADKFGQWTTLPTTMPINPVHVAMLHNGKILVVSGSGNVAGNTNYQAGLFDPATGMTATQPLSWDMFCNGMVILPDGRPLIVGGTLQYDPFHGETHAAVYDPATNLFANVSSMSVGRWYPTAIMLGDGRIMAFSGLDVNGNTTRAVEFFDGSKWSSPVNAPWTPPLYPRMTLLPNGQVFYSGPGAGSALFDPSTQNWNQNVAITNYGGTRTYGSTVLLPLTPANGYKPTVMIMGGASPATASTELIDLSQTPLAWTLGPVMSEARIEMNATILPTGTVLALGGSVYDEQNSYASFNADLYDPTTSTFSSAGVNAFPRLYHSVSLLLPDATVWVAGGNPTRGTYQNQIEIYQPAYLFTNDGQGHVLPATRPTIGSAPATAAYGSAFAVSTPDASSINSIALIRAGAVTHAFDMDQRMIGLSYSDQGNGTLLVNAPVNGSLAPPGYYLLFLVNASGVPSVASFVQVETSDFALGVTPASQQVTQGGSTTFTATVTAQSGFTGTVSLSSTGLPAGVTANFSVTSLTTGDSTLNVTIGNSVAPGSYPFTVTATSGTLTHSANATVQVQASGNYSVSVTPTVKKVFQSGQTKFIVNVTPQNGFADPVTLGVAGLPDGATGSFTIPALSSGNSTLNIVVGSSVVPGSYPLTITGVSGALSHNAVATLTVLAQGTFTVTLTPASQAVTRGSTSTYTVTITPLSGFHWPVDLTVKGTGAHITASLDPISMGPSGTSTLTVNLDNKAPRGTHTLRVFGTSAQLSKFGKLTLTIQ